MPDRNTKESWRLIYNPASGSFKPSILERLKTGLEKEGVSLVQVPTEGPGHATELARQAGQEHRVAVLGGDGTLNEAANGMLGSDVPLVFLPMGTANVMALELGIGMDPLRAGILQKNGELKPVFPALIEGRCALLMISFGFDARAVKNVNLKLKKWAGKAAYGWSGFRAMLNKGRPVSLSIDGGEPIIAEWVIVSRAGFYAGRYRPHPDAGLLIDKLAYTAVSGNRLSGFLLKNLLLGLGSRPSGVEQGFGDRFVVEGEAPFPAQVDGDLLGEASRFVVERSKKPLILCFPKR